MKTYIFRLKVDNAQDLNDSKLLWQNQDSNTINIAKLQSVYDQVVFFQIKTKPNTIKYWYKNSQQEEEQQRRKINLKDGHQIQIDKFNCYNVVLKSDIKSQDHLQYTFMYQQNEQRRKILSFNKQNFIHVPNQNKNPQFLVEHQQQDQNYIEVLFDVLLSNIPQLGNSILLQIKENDLEYCLFYDFSLYKSEQNIQFKILYRKLIGSDDIIFYKYQTFAQEVEKQSTRLDDLIQKSQILDENVKSVNELNSQFTQIGNFFSVIYQSTQQTIESQNIFSTQIIQNSRKKQEQQFCRTQQINKYDNEKKQNLQQQQNNQIKKDIEFNKIKENFKTQQQDFHQSDDEKLESTAQLQPIIIDTNMDKQDYQKLILKIQEQDQMIKSLKQDYNQQISKLMLSITDLNLQLKKEKEEIEQLKQNNSLKFIQNYRNRRLNTSQYLSKLQSKSTVQFMNLNPVIQQAKIENFKECQSFRQTNKSLIQIDQNQNNQKKNKIIIKEVNNHNQQFKTEI
ncbi:unnamed protein product [Paramecium pentaurelia]|uniref:Uncharacterized protein n=1 Tax=Paramecium pentaurelia TaxID=43138 RepID=A0A8S1YF72_9CILI|nr:unnamed protein product [Paramecium pentaurelia]